MTWSEAEPATTAVRELEEETGYVVTPDKLAFWPIKHHFSLPPEVRSAYPQGVTANVEHVYSCVVDSTQPVRLDKQEHTQTMWCKGPQAMQHVWSWGNRRVIRLLLGRTMKVDSD